MGQSTEELTELTDRVAATRHALAADVDALQDRMSPSAMVDRRKAAARDRMHSAKDKVMGTAHDVRDRAEGSATGAGDSVKDAAHDTKEKATDQIEGSPLAAGMVAFGAGMVLSALFPATREEQQAAQRVVDTAKEKAQPMVDEAKSRAQDIGSDVKQSASDAAQEVRGTAADAASTVQDEGRSSAESVRSQAQG